MPDTPTGSYIGSYGLPVATGETKIGLSAWDADLVQGSYLSVESLDSDNLTLAAPLLEDTDYAIVPILAQVEYPAEGSTLDLVLPDSVTLLDYYASPPRMPKAFCTANTAKLPLRCWACMCRRMRIYRAAGLYRAGRQHSEKDIKCNHRPQCCCRVSFPRQ